MQNLKKTNARQLTSALMAIAMIATTTLQIPITSRASEKESVIAAENQIEEVQKESLIEESSLEDSLEAFSTETSEEQQILAIEDAADNQKDSDIKERLTNVESTATITETITEAEMESVSESEIEESATEASVAEDPFASLDPTSGLTEEALSEIDFSSKRLLLAADESVIIDPEDVLSSYAGVYLLQYDTETEAKYAYAYYYNKSEFVDVDTVISVADGDNSANAAEPMAITENPIAELQAAVAENPVKAAGAVAVIDTGVNDVANVTESVSMIGDNTADENGHGTKMANLIVEQNPDVSILSIKALGADGTGDISAVYAAIQYAIDKKVSVINLSMSAVSTAENAALTSIIDEATKAGIAVVGAAGNKGMDVRFFVPGNIESAYIIGAADENGKRLETSNYGDTVDFNVVADSTSEATAKFSGYFTLNGAVADEKLVFPTDYVKEDDTIDFNGPEIRHQISYYDYKGSMTDLVWIGMRQAKTALDEDETYFTTYIGYVEDAEKVKDLDVCVDFMDTYKEHTITDECIVDLENMQVKIPVTYKDASITVRWYMTNASYGYAYDVDANYMMADTPEPFKAANNSNNSLAGLNFQKAKQFQEGTFSTGFTHTPDSMNHCMGNFSANDFKEGNKFTINDGYLAIVDESNNYASTIRGIFGPASLRWYYRPEGSNKLVPQDVNIQTFLTHFSNVTRAAGENDATTKNVTVGEDVSYLFNSVGGKGEGTIKVDTTGNGHWDSKISGTLGWVFGTCAYDFLEGWVPSFQAGGQIICTNIGSDGTAYFFYYCRSPKAQWSGGSFSITPIKKGYLKIHKSSSNPEMTNGNSCYSFDQIDYGVFTDYSCINNIAILNLDENGYSKSLELDPGTYYVREAYATPGSGYQTNSTVYTVNVTEGSTADAPILCETQDTPLNDPLGIVINKTSADGSTADLSGAIYTITYYPKQYSSLAEIAAENDSSVVPIVWKIQTLKNADGTYTARLDDDHVVLDGESAKDVFGKNGQGMYLIPLGTVIVKEETAPAGFTTEGASVSSATDGTTIFGENGVYLFNLVDENSSVYLKCGNSLSNVIDQEHPDEDAITLIYAEQRSYAGIQLYKYDNDPDNPPVSKVHLNDIQFAIINANTWPVVNYAGNEIPQWGVVEVIKTDVNGYAATGRYDLPVGEYVVQELRSDATFDGATFTDGTSDYANYHYLWDGHQVKVTLTSENTGTLVSVGPFYDQLANGGIELYKRDSSTEDGSASGTASLAGIRFKIVNDNYWTILNYAGEEIAPGGVVQVIETDQNGYAATGPRDIPVGDYTVEEIRSNASFDGKNFDEGTSDYANYFYYWDGNNKASVSVTKDQVNTLVSAGTFTNQIAAGGIQLYKYDSTTQKDAVKGASLAGIKFGIFNDNTWKVRNKDGHWIAPLDCVQVIETDENGHAQTGNKDIPSGDYVIRELRMDATFDGETFYEGTSDYANDSYWWTDERDNVSLTAESAESYVWAKTFFDAPVYGPRNDFKFVKKNGETGETLSSIPFKVTNNTTGETHYIVTGSDGSFDSSINKTTNTNANDEVLSQYAADDIIPQSVISSLVSDAGLWFRVNSDGKTVSANESYGALPFGTYTITEIKTEATRNMRMYTGSFTIENVDPVLDLGTIENMPIEIETTLTDINNSHVTKATKSVTLIDHVAYTNLDTTKTYTLTGTLYVKGDILTALVSETVTFTPAKAHGIQDVSFTFDASNLQGKSIVAFEELTMDGDLISEHKDQNDKSQTVSFPKIRTRALDQTTGINQIEASTKTILVDAVSYTELLPGKEYTITGKLMDKRNGEAILVDGKEITASTTFTPTETKGMVDVVFTFDSTAVAPKTIVVFEALIYEGVEVAVHADIEDMDQIVYIPKICTTAIADDTKDHITEAKKALTIVDTVTYEGLEVGREYTVKGSLMDKETQKAVEVDGKEVTAETTFTPETADGTVDVTFKFDSIGLKNTALVVFETLYSEEKEIGVHADIEDEAQTVYVPEIRTHAKDSVTDLDHTEAKPQATIIDTVSYTNLLVGKEYTVTGTLMNKATGEAISINGEPLTASTTFTAEASKGNVEIVFMFDASAIAGTTVVAFETVTYKGVEVGFHADITDEDQMVYIPDVHTTATATDTKDHVTGANEEVTITDKVTLTGLKVGAEYTIQGVLMDKSTKDELKVDGESIVSEETFIADAADMTVMLTYTLNASKLAGTTTVIFETLYTEGKEVGRHHELEDDGQTVYIPEIHTTAADQKTEMNHTNSEEVATIVDTVFYSHLLPNKEYTVKGTLMNTETGEAVLIDGKEVTAEATFTAEKSDGSVDVIFNFDSSKIAPTTVVAFETIEYKGIQIGIHADIEDKNQTVYIPKIKTTAIGEDTEDHIEKAKIEAAIVDTVEYNGLEIGRKYTMVGKLVDKETGERITDAEGNEITATETFTAEAANGIIDITFRFDTSALAGRSLVAFEFLTTEEKEVAVHADLADEGQTVKIPEIHTTAINQATGNHDGTIANEITILDEVFYKNLIPGKEYTVTGNLMVKETGEPLTVNGKEVIASKSFTAEKEDGSIIIEFTFDSSALSGKHIVAFEDMEYKGVSIGSHEDIADENQTINFPVKPQNPPVVTGDDSTPLPYIFTLSVALLVALAVVVVLVKRRKKQA